ncbi:hypothetical protein OCU04_011423 [Sclerotinia nivalis]|nr:hypothetical protein OCU04_011423 [Sclerotinia nivalis]
MFRVHGRADPNWAAPEQKYPQMEGRSTSSPCNIFGIGALLYYMIKGKEIDHRAWKIGMPGSAASQEVKLHFGGDLITEPVAEQQEYSKALIWVILECLTYLPSDRITAAELRKVSARATAASSREWLNSETQYDPGDPATIFEPQKELQPNDYTVADLSLKDKISMHCPPKDHRETLRARAEKWLSNFWLFPDSVKSQEAREKQRLVYERQVEKQRQEAAAVEVKKQAEAQALADLNAELRLVEEQEEAARIARVIAREEKIAQLRAEAARKIAAIRGEGEEQILLPQPNNKRDRSPEPPQQIVHKKLRVGLLSESSNPEAPVAQGSGSQVMDVDIGQDRTILPPRDKGKGKEIVAVPPKIPPVSDVPAPTESGVSAQAGPAPLEPAPSGLTPLSKPPTASGVAAQAGSDFLSKYQEERRERAAVFDKAEDEKVKKRKENWAREVREGKRERQESIDQHIEEGKERAAAEYDRMMARENAWDKSMAEGRKESSKLIAPSLGGASRSLSSNVDTPSMRRRWKSPPRPSPLAAGAIQYDIDDDDDVEEVAPTGPRARSPPRPIPPRESPRYRPASPEGVPIGMKPAKPLMYCSICGKEYKREGACEAHIKKYHNRRKGKPVDQRPANPEEDPTGKPVKKRKAAAKGDENITVAELRKYLDPRNAEA